MSTSEHPSRHVTRLEAHAGPEPANRAPRRRPTAAALALALLALAVTTGIAASLVVVDTTNVRLRIVQSEFEDGFDSGWHTHPGPVIVQVQEGSFKIYQGSCEPTVVHEGETLVEVPFVPVRAIAKGRIRWTTSQILPVGFAAQDPAGPPCR